MSNFQFSIFNFRENNNAGFSLLELIVSVTIIGIVATASAALLAQSLRAARRSAEIAEVKQNGDAALIAIERALREGLELYVPGCQGANQDSPQSNVSPPLYFEGINKQSGEREFLSIEQNGVQLGIYQYSNSTFSSTPTLRQTITTSDVQIVPSSFLLSCFDSTYKRDRVKVQFSLQGAETTKTFHAAAMLRNK